MGCLEPSVGQHSDVFSTHRGEFCPEHSKRLKWQLQLGGNAVRVSYWTSIGEGWEFLLFQKDCGVRFGRLQQNLPSSLSGAEGIRKWDPTTKLSNRIQWWRWCWFQDSPNRLGRLNKTKMKNDWFWCFKIIKVHYSNNFYRNVKTVLRNLKIYCLTWK